MCDRALRAGPCNPSRWYQRPVLFLHTQTVCIQVTCRTWDRCVVVMPTAGCPSFVKPCTSCAGSPGFCTRTWHRRCRQPYDRAVHSHALVSCKVLGPCIITRSRDHFLGVVAIIIAIRCSAVLVQLVLPCMHVLWQHSSGVLVVHEATPYPERCNIQWELCQSSMRHGAMPHCSLAVTVQLVGAPVTRVPKLHPRQPAQHSCLQAYSPTSCHPPPLKLGVVSNRL